MREFLVTNKSRILQVFLLLVVFFIISAYVNGKNIYNQKMKMMEEKSKNVSVK